MFETKEERYVRIALTVLSIVLALGGLALIALVDWRLAAGIFLLLWASDLNK